MTELSWLFVLNFPNGGSTALAKLLLTARGTLALTRNAEGQWLVPSLCAPLVRWDPSTAIDFDMVRERWTEEACRRAGENSYDQCLVVEKSPPNMCRYKSLAAAFHPMTTTIVIMTRDPIATCASWHFRYGRDLIAKHWGLANGVPANEQEYFEELAEHWLIRASYLDEARIDAYDTFRYEDLTDDPLGVLAKLADRLPVLKGVDLAAPLSVKDYPPRPINNMNGSGARALTGDQRAFIRRRLSRDAGLVERLGYSVRTCSEDAVRVRSARRHDPAVATWNLDFHGLDSFWRQPYSKQVARKCPAVLRGRPATNQAAKRVKRWPANANLLRSDNRMDRHLHAEQTGRLWAQALASIEAKLGY